MKSVLKGLRQYADPPSSFDIRCNKHFRVTWEMLNDDGDRVKVGVTLGVSPNKYFWKKTHKRQLQNRFNELNISTEVTHI